MTNMPIPHTPEEKKNLLPSKRIHMENNIAELYKTKEGREHIVLQI